MSCVRQIGQIGSQELWEGDGIIIPNLQMRKLSLRKVEELAPSNSKIKG